jgi:hypothetical protein
MPRIVFHRLAERELLEAMGFHERAMVGLESAFLVRGSEIRILAIANLRRQPAYWAGRR